MGNSQTKFPVCYSTDTAFGSSISFSSATVFTCLKAWHLIMCTSWCLSNLIIYMTGCHFFHIARREKTESWTNARYMEGEKSNNKIKLTWVLIFFCNVRFFCCVITNRFVILCTNSHWINAITVSNFKFLYNPRHRFDYMHTKILQFSKTRHQFCMHNQLVNS